MAISDVTIATGMQIWLRASRFLAVHGAVTLSLLAHWLRMPSVRTMPMVRRWLDHGLACPLYDPTLPEPVFLATETLRSSFPPTVADVPDIGIRMNPTPPPTSVHESLRLAMLSADMLASPVDADPPLSWAILRAPRIQYGAGIVPDAALSIGMRWYVVLLSPQRSWLYRLAALAAWYHALGRNRPTTLQPVIVIGVSSIANARVIDTIRHVITWPDTAPPILLAWLPDRITDTTTIWYSYRWDTPRMQWSAIAGPWGGIP